ncbi:DUF1848 domain-containing protein [Sporomusa acidovorans]|uniref:DUF1848 domain-containing protein n=1 Tax=Sporomusa acidovorans (strain ATCC 49682 / DSM 3132 / Mol) TaxID=1123286 RepID=A0ABZ3IYN0_SPOA4|nr:DUF1848 domain-containing protein [Sporomusa acidovorans]OZC22400.1 hypothetical protein SPACI_14490 [Sporomusa acidovorans DSM 3132]SDE48118.1 protein of unknown function [Sporomusa acidovorans]
MIISASRRTDIPAFYAEWFMYRLQAGVVYVRNPRNPGQIASVALNPAVVDCIVFWTKNARPMLNKLDVIDKMGYPYYFQFTITPYDQQVEKRLPPKAEIIETFQYLSEKIGKQRVIWRYDPVIVSPEFSVQYHLEAFGNLCDHLGDYTGQCMISFIDVYAKNRRNLRDIMACETEPRHKNKIAAGFSAIAQAHKLSLAACSETMDFSAYGIERAACIDKRLIEKITDSSLGGKKDPNQRPDCGCLESIDIGAYDCCPYGCIYCYGTKSEAAVQKNRQLHSVYSPLLVGVPAEEDHVGSRACKSLKNIQSSLF